MEAGTIQYRTVALMASADFFKLTVMGKGSHGANPWLGRDPIVISAQVLEGLQHIVSRQEDITTAPVIITVGAINGGVRNNIIPDSVVMLGTVRALNNAMREDVQERIRHTAEHIAASAGATIRYENETKALVTSNPVDLTKKTVPLLEKAIGKENVLETGWKTMAEDYSFYGTKYPAFFFLLGGMPRGSDPAKAPAHHTAQFAIDESALETGIKAFCQIAFGYTK
ncbi:MAG: peptidase dimerization domain-containing protein [Flavihumibacter sp.]